MSIRTIIEINHDYLGLKGDDPADALRRLLQALRTSDITGQLNRAAGAPIDVGGGVRVLAQRHHSEALKLTVK